ncbi:MAG: squalene/phytoene synthase family protein [Alphaproteobacteria bacterium]
MAIATPDRIDAARAGENFPVASRLVAPALRHAVLAFYRVARGADDVADDPALAPADKAARLVEIDAFLADEATPQSADALGRDCLALRRICALHAVDARHARHLLQAFQADAASRGCRGWSDLLAYCRFSAVPVGRFLLELHGEGKEAQDASDRLCTALQVLNHLQDCGTDWVRLRRCYLPMDWMSAEGASTADLEAQASSPGLRRVFDRILDATDALLIQASVLPGRIAAAGLAREAAGILALARDLSTRLRAQDPLAGRVAAGRAAKAAIFLAAALRARPLASGSSFALALRLLPRAARPAGAAIYALARRLDDIADGPAPEAAKRHALDLWREEIRAAAEGRAVEPLAVAVGRHAGVLPLEEFGQLIDGLAHDCGAGAARAPDGDAFRLYCRQVAGSIGVLVLAACGHSSDGDRAFGAALGQALQMVNVLRDIDEDAARGRCYLPQDMLLEAGLDPALPPGYLPGDPRLSLVRAALAAESERAFARARDLAPSAPGARVFAIRLMATTYRRILARLIIRPADRPRLGPRDHAAAFLSAARGAF